jgi:hypothetical protein
MFDTLHHHKAYKKLLPKWFGPFVIRKVFVDNGFHKLKMLMAHHIQMTLIMISWKRFWICDSKNINHNEFGSDVIWCN